jgi:hypothetical protein
MELIFVHSTEYAHPIKRAEIKQLNQNNLHWKVKIKMEKKNRKV